MNNKNAESTREQYGGTAQHYLIFTKIYSLNPLQTKNGTKILKEWEQCLLHFIAWKHECVGIGWKAMRNHIYAIRNFLFQHQIEIDVHEKAMRTLHSFIAGERRDNPSGTGSKPVTLKLMQNWVNIIQKDQKLSNSNKLCWMFILSIAWFGTKRISEYTNYHLLIHQLQFEFDLFSNNFMNSTYCILNRTKGKTYQYGGDLYAVFICTCSTKVCVLCLAKKYVNTRLTNSTTETLLNESIFKLDNNEPINKYAMGKKLKALCKESGIDPNTISGHGLRKGGAQYALKKGVPATTVLKQGDWRSMNSLKHYNENAPRENQIEIYKRHLK